MAGLKPYFADALAVSALTLLAVRGWTLGFFRPPVEDAAILLRYADHLSGGHGIVWNIGEHPVEGATDFLFMVLTAALGHASGGVAQAGWLIIQLSIVATLALAYAMIRVQLREGVGAAFLAVSFLALGPGYFHAAHGFGAPFFAMLAVVAWWMAVRASEQPASLSRALGFSVAALALGLTRPEGFVFGGLMFLAVVYRAGFRAAIPTARIYLVVLGGGALVYYFWRWHYFGYPMSPPAYRKGGVHFDALLISTHHVFAMIPFVAVVIGACVDKALRRDAIFALIPIVGFTVMWVMVADDQNIGWRFQYAVLPMGTLACVPVLAELARRAQLHEGSPWMRAARVVLAVPFLFLYWQTVRMPAFGGYALRYDGGNDIGLKRVGDLLKPYESKGYVVATTEAGRIPFYSGWKAIDTWGLNDVEIAKRHGIDDQTLERDRPHVIMIELHERDPADPSVSEKEWAMMCQVLVRFAGRNGYKLAGAFGGSMGALHVYYVRSDFPDSDAIAQAIHKIMPYPYFGMAFNYADVLDSEKVLGQPRGSLLEELSHPAAANF